MYLCAVQKRINIAAFSVLLVLFYFLVSTNYSCAVARTDSSQNHELPENRKSAITASESHSTVVQLTSLRHFGAPTKTSGKTFFGYSVLFPKDIKLVQVSYSRQIAYSKNILYRLKEIDRLFPFHTFWWFNQQIFRLQHFCAFSWSQSSTGNLFV